MAYLPPKAKLGVYFTRNLNETNYNNGKWLLGYYFRDSKLSKPPYAPITNFQGMLNYLNENYPTYIESLGDLMKTITSDKLIAAMKDAAAKGYVSYPRPSVFASSIISKTGYTLSEQIGDVATAVGDSVVGLGKILWVLSVVGIAILVYIEFGTPLKALFKKAKQV